MMLSLAPTSWATSKCDKRRNSICYSFFISDTRRNYMLYNEEIDHMKGVIMFEMIIGIALVIAGGIGMFAMCEDIDEYMQNQNTYITQIDA